MGIERWVFFAVSTLLIMLPWLRGGTPVWSQTYPVLVSVLLVFLIFPAARRRHGTWKQAARAMLLDPSCVASLFFMILLSLQWWNAGRSLFFNPISETWGYTQSHAPNWPSAIEKSEALEMLRWFFPATVILIAVRHGLTSRSKRRLFGVLAVNGGVLALFGIIQYISGTQSIFWIYPLGCPFFASFGYSNHAGPYFLLIAAISLALVFRAMLYASRHTALWVVCLFLAFVGTILSLSRASLGLSLILVLIAGFTLFYLLWPRLRPTQRINLLAVICATICLCFFVLDRFASRDLRAQWLPTKAVRKTSLVGELRDSRGVARDIAVDIWQENPWFGVGGWGFRHFVVLKLPPEKARQLELGQANVHNDPLQFLAEFGLVGTGLMSTVILTLVISALRKKAFSHPVAIPVLAGVGLVFLHSLIDLPFRCPAILCTWLGALAALPALAKKSEIKQKTKSQKTWKQVISRTALGYRK